MAIFDVEVAESLLEELVERAKAGEEILIKDGSSVVKLEPIFAESEESK